MKRISVALPGGGVSGRLMGKMVKVKNKSSRAELDIRDFLKVLVKDVNIKISVLCFQPPHLLPVVYLAAWENTLGLGLSLR